MTNTFEDRKKKLIYRSWHRGCKETDLILGDFAKEALMAFDEAQVELYEEFLEENDWDIYAWLTGSKPTPKEYNNWLIEQIREFLAKRSAAF